MSNRDRYFDEWNEDTSIDWWNEGRRKLNAVIRLVNKWTLGGCSSTPVEVIHRHIDMGLQTFAAQDGGSGWAEQLVKLRDYVDERSSKKSA
jgi:hypothetical protein